LRKRRGKDNLTWPKVQEVLFFLLLFLAEMRFFRGKFCSKRTQMSWVIRNLISIMKPTRSFYPVGISIFIPSI